MRVVGLLTRHRHQKLRKSPPDFHGTSCQPDVHPLTSSQSSEIRFVTGIVEIEAGDPTVVPDRQRDTLEVALSFGATVYQTASREICDI